MSENIILIALSVLPVLVLATFIYRKDKYQKEPMGMLFKAFFFGCFSVLPAILMESVLTIFNSFSGMMSGLYTGYIVAGCSEELCKLLLLSLAVWKSRYFDEYFDGIVYAVFVSLGFAGLENMLYVFRQETFSASLMTGSVRAILSVPGHFLFAVVMGYYFALAKFNPKDRASNLFKAFLFPMFLHGTFDALLMVPEAIGGEESFFSLLLFPVFIYFDIKLWKIGLRRLSHLQQLSGGQRYEESYEEERHQEVNYDGDDRDDNIDTPSNPFSGFTWNV